MTFLLRSSLTKNWQLVIGGTDNIKKKEKNTSLKRKVTDMKRGRVINRKDTVRGLGKNKTL